jgi:hypothetical protein
MACRWARRRSWVRAKKLGFWRCPGPIRDISRSAASSEWPFRGRCVESRRA